MIKSKLSPDQCGPVGWLLFHKVKGHQFNSWSGHMPGLQVGPSWGAYERQLIDVSVSHQCFLFLFLLHLLSL